MRGVLVTAAVFHVTWGVAAVASPDAMFRWFSIEPLNYPYLWRAIGWMVAFYGLGCAVAASNPVRHWPIVMVGLLAKISGPVLFAQAAVAGVLPWKAGWLFVATDVAWWVPFGLILREAYRHLLSETDPPVSPAEVVRILNQSSTQHGNSLAELASTNRLLVVFLRHAGCTFCRETLRDIADARAALEAMGTRILLVHMNEDSHAGDFFRKYELDDVDRISDPERRLYRVFGLQRGRLKQLFGWKVWLRGFDAGILHGHGVGFLQGDGFQMPGIFLLEDGEILRSFRHKSASDRPEYRQMAECKSSARRQA